MRRYVGPLMCVGGLVLLMTLWMTPVDGALDRYESSAVAPVVPTQRVSLSDLSIGHEVAMLVAGTVLIGVAAALRRAA